MKKTKVKSRPNFPNTRKALRKQKRQEKKVNRKEHYTHKKTAADQALCTTGRFVKRPADTPDHEHGVKKKKPKLQPTLHEILNKERQKDQNEEKRLKSQMEEQRRKIMLQANEDEEKVIKKLEKQLGLKKTKNKNNFFADDGLDYLLEICDRTTTEQIVAAEKHLANVEDESAFEDDLAIVTGKDVDSKKDKKTKKSKKKEANNDDNEDDDEESEIEDLSEDEEFSGDDEGESEGDLEGSDEEEEISDESEDESENESSKKTVSKAKIENKSKDKKLEKTAAKLKSEKNLTAKIDDDGEYIENPFSDDEISHISGDDEDMCGDDDDMQIVEKSDVKSKQKPDEWEDIYGRKRDKEGNVIKEEKGVYIPPHLRNKDSTSDKDMELIERQIKSILNKLSGSNLHWASTSLETVYSSHSRASVNTALSRCWLRSLVGASLSGDRLMSEHAALLAAASANVASDTGAHFLLVLAKRFDEMMTSPPEPIADKRLVNLVGCFAHLYNFKMYHSSLLYDVLNRLIDDLTEKNIECILAVLRIVGGVLRKDDPIALKNYIQSAQAKVAGLNENAATGSRIKFLLEVLLAVKNNNLTKIPNYDPSYSEQLKKTLKTVARPGNYVTALNIRMEDLLKADERGKWWIVGSAWEGQRVLPETKVAQPPAPGVDSKLLQLARKQRMNTDVRRSVFCVIMSAEDYMDAFEKLNHLGLRGQQHREIVHVLLACCLQENTFNRYYALLAQKLIESDRKYLLSIQCSVWDKIKELESLSKQTLSNLAQLLTHLIMEKGLALSVLKVIQFSDLNKGSVKFMRQILLAIIMSEDLQASREVFHRIAKAPKLHMFRESLRLFIQHFLIRNAGKRTSVLSDEEMGTLKERSVEVEKILSMHESKLRF